MKITATTCQLVEKGNCPSIYDLTHTLREFGVEFVDAKSDRESFDNEEDAAVVFVPKNVDPWSFFTAVHSLKPDGFVTEKIPSGIIVYMSWENCD